jgi:hypothetical protein
MRQHEMALGSQANLIAVLEDAVRQLNQNVLTSHRYRMVSNLQAVPYAVAFGKWVKDGEQGPPPTGSTAEIKAVIYDQASSAAELKAFSVVSNVAAAELGESAVLGLREGKIIISFTSLRGFIERTAHARATADAVRPILEAPMDGPLTPVLELSEKIHKAMYGTQREWKKVVDADFRKTPTKETKYLLKENIADATPDNILKSIDKLDKHAPGARLVYDILCEFLHPNVGDLWGTTLYATSSIDEHGVRHLTRILGRGSRTLEGLPDQRKIYDKLFDVCAEIIPLMPRAIEELDSIAERAIQLSRRFAHSLIKQRRGLFSGFDLCPCLSGKTVTACTGLRKT